jgi:glycosyltransferase involved in cell wall biosynthesis
MELHNVASLNQTFNMTRLFRQVALVAVLTPVYNGARFLRETMECVQASDYTNMVHVILDNASTDATPEIIDSFRGRRVPIIVRRNPETIPILDNHNAVVAMCPTDAKYFRNLCADDLMTPDAITRKVEVAERHPDVTVVGCQWRATGLCGSELPHDRSVFDSHDIVRWYLRRETMALSGTHNLFRTSAVDFPQPFYDGSANTSFDSEANIRLVMKGKYGFVHKELAILRMHEFSQTAMPGVRDTRLFTWLILLDRYGPQVMTKNEYAECRKRYRRHLLRHLLLARWKRGDKRIFDLQMRRFAEINDSPTFPDFAAALLEWGYFAATAQRHRVGCPRSNAESLNTQTAQL